MCRNIGRYSTSSRRLPIKQIRAASLQSVKKITGFNTPSKVNEAPFFSAVDEVARISGQLPASLCASNQKSWRRRRNTEVRIIVSDPQRRNHENRTLSVF
jgi:hypothetical protein